MLYSIISLCLFLFNALIVLFFPSLFKLHRLETTLFNLAFYFMVSFFKISELLKLLFYQLFLVLVLLLFHVLSLFLKQIISLTNLSQPFFLFYHFIRLYLFLSLLVLDHLSLFKFLVSSLRSYLSCLVPLSHLELLLFKPLSCSLQLKVFFLHKLGLLSKSIGCLLAFLIQDVLKLLYLSSLLVNHLILPVNGVCKAIHQDESVLR